MRMRLSRYYGLAESRGLGKHSRSCHQPDMRGSSGTRPGHLPFSKVPGNAGGRSNGPTPTFERLRRITAGRLGLLSSSPAPPRTRCCSESIPTSMPRAPKPPFTVSFDFPQSAVEPRAGLWLVRRRVRWRGLGRCLCCPGCYDQPSLPPTPTSCKGRTEIPINF